MIKTIIPISPIKDLEHLPVLKSTEYTLNVADNKTIDFLNTLSKAILKNPIFKAEPSFIALGFWLRKTNVKRILKENNYVFSNPNIFPRPLGCVFHLCPSNVDTMFIYSLVLLLLGGNKNIVRLSSKTDNQSINTLFGTINNLLALPEYTIYKEYINVISYDRSDKLSEYLSLQANARVIWGGDATVEQFKKYRTKPKVKDLFFTDKISMSVIALPTLEEFKNNKEHIVQNLYNDIYTFNQKGCSSPHSILLICKNENEQQAIINEIYNALVSIAESNYNEDLSSIASLKLNQSIIDIIEHKVDAMINTSNYLTFAHTSNKNSDHSCGAGYVYYDIVDSLNKLPEYVDPKTQTITYWGIEENDLKDILNFTPIESIDRIVPIGQALDFDYIWDGYNIFTEGLAFKNIKTK